MTGWLLDTNVLSELRRPKPEAKVVAFVAAQPLDRLFVSAVTLAEIRFGIELVGEAGRRAELGDWLTHKVRPMFDQRILPISEDVMFKWRLMVEEGRKTGHTFSQPDLIIAATSGIPSFYGTATNLWIALDRCITSAKRCMRGRSRISGMLGMSS